MDYEFNAFEKGKAKLFYGCDVCFEVRCKIVKVINTYAVQE
jgi:hypothetical protein